MFNNKNVQMRVDEIYPIYTKALMNAGLVKKDKFPILSQCRKEDSKKEEEEIEEEDPEDDVKKTKDLRAAYLLICYCQCWSK